jgi:hypothetical protein
VSRSDLEDPDDRMITVWDGRKAWTVPLGPVVYFVRADPQVSTLVKIGKTLYLQRRLDMLRNMSPVPLFLMAVLRNYGRTEEMLHTAFAHVRAHSEWFDLGPDPMATVTETIGDLGQYEAVAALQTVWLPALSV